MASLQAIKSRKDTVVTIRKITKAMELVATSKIRRARQQLDKVLQYSDRIEGVFYNLEKKIKDWEQIIKINPQMPRVFIIVTSDMGMCGAYNANIIKLAKQEIKPEDYVIIIGSRGLRPLLKHFQESQILKTFSQIGDEPNYDIVDQMLDQIVPLLFNEAIRSIHILYTKFINSITLDATDSKIFPISKRRLAQLSEHNQVSKNAEFEPNPETVLRLSLPLYLGAIIFARLASSKLSEMSSRRIAMERSSDNALEIIEHLNKQYNKIRQSSITQEITEIIAGAQDE